MEVDEKVKAETDVPVKSGVTPYLTLEGAGAAADFYVKAFGGQIVAKQEMPPGSGKHIHIHLYINDGSVMLSDAMPEQGHPFEKLQGFLLHIQSANPEADYKRAVDAGCEVVTPMERMFWGDLYGQVRDAWGVLWSIGGK
jgi:uncharacterized glyoxalase superfamily protein PhnB